MKGTIHERIDDFLPIYYGWVITAACLLTVLSVFSINISFGVFFDSILNDFDTSRSRISLLFSLQTLSLYLSAALVGNVIDRYGTRRLIVVGTGVLVVGIVATVTANSFPVLFVAYTLVVGVGMGILYVIGFATVPRWFDRRRGTATAIATMGTGFATLAAPPIASVLLETYDWRETYLLFTGVSVCTLLLVAIVIADSPRSVDVDTGSEFRTRLPESASLEETWSDQLRESLPTVRSSSFLYLVVGWILVFIPLYIILVHIVAYSADIGLSRGVGVLALSIMGGMTIPGRLAFGAVGDRIGRTKLFVFLAFAMNALVFLLPALRTPTLLLAFAASYGLVYGGTAAMLSPIVADLYGTRYLNTLYGIAALAFGVAATLGPFSAGLTFDVLGTFTPVILASGVTGMIGAACIYAAVRYEVRDGRTSTSAR